MTTSTQKLSLEYLKTIGIVTNSPTGRGFANPVDLAVSLEGRILVLNRGAPTFTRVGVCSLDEEYLYEIGSMGDGDGQFRLPTAIALDSRDRVYIADENNHRISVFDLSGEFLGKWGERGSAEGQLDGPSGLAFDADDAVYVVDQNNNRVQKFSSDGRFLASFGEHGGGEGQFDMPWGVTLDSRGDVYVADWRNDRVQKFAPDGRFLASFGESGHGDGQFHRPSSVAVDTDGHIYVADWGNERVQMLGPNGGHLLTLMGQATLSKWAQEYLDANPEEARDRDVSDLMPGLPPQYKTPYQVSSQTEAYFWGPTSVNLDGDGRLYVTESSRHRIQIYRKG
jgi:DNA-binding beta-propeller fold protein YncE